VRTPSTASSVRSVKAVFQHIASVHHLCHSALQDHQAHPDHLAKKEAQANPEVLVSPEAQENKELHAQLKTLLASSAQPVPMAHLDLPAHPEDPETMDNPAVQDKEAAVVHPDHQDQPDQLASQDNPEAQDNQDSQVSPELDRAADQDQKDHPAQQETQEDPVSQEAQDNQEDKDHPDLQELQVSQASPVEMVIQDNLEALAFLETTLPTAHVLVAPVSLCAGRELNRVRNKDKSYNSLANASL